MRFPALQELGMVEYSCNPNTREAEAGAEDRKFKVILSFIESLRSASAT